jgi:poly(3-hydroxybutyrate) depolymerase
LHGATVGHAGDGAGKDIGGQDVEKGGLGHGGGDGDPLGHGDGASVEAHRKFYDEYNAVLDMDADYYLDTIRTVFQEFRLVHGTWDVRNPEGKLERVRPQDIKTTAHLTVEGELDDISGSGQTEAAHKLCSGIVRQEHHHLEAKGAGHYGIFSGRRWRDVVYPHVKRS